MKLPVAFRNFLLVLILLFCVPAGIAKDDEATAAAKELFARYVDLGSRYDPAVASLYSDAADIQNTRYYPDGQTKTMKMPAAVYKKMIAAAMPVAKARNDQDSYSRTTFTPLDGGVKIQTMRHNNLKNYDSWLVLVVRKEPGGWKIIQELSQSRP